MNLFSTKPLSAFSPLRFVFSIFVFLGILHIVPIPPLSAQTSVQGVVNTYTRLIEQDNCANAIRIEANTGLEAGMPLLLIQMTGNGINLNNNSSFGSFDSNNIGGAGQYEYNEIAAVSGDTLWLEYALRHDYQMLATQVVALPHYEDVLVDGTVTAQPWNGTVGGVVFLVAENSITLQADVDVTGQGFRGGSPVVYDDINCNALTFNNDYFYGSGNWRGASKGEGFAPVAAGMSTGRGPAANGGGGGNNHNSGGGGGALFGRGGQGGENNEPSFGGCDGFYPGFGGYSLPPQQDWMLLGGGGGAGHSNNFPSAGGNGGGIIVLIAPEIIGQGGQLLANGQDGQSVTGDGGGGGGAGGMVFLVADAVSGMTPDVQINGGNGGSVNNGNQQRCFGPGGGGGGGGFFTNLSALSAERDGGIPGNSFNSGACGTGTNGAEAGQPGYAAVVSDLFAVERAPVAAFAYVPTDTVLCVQEVFSLAVLGEASFSWEYSTPGSTVWLPISGQTGQVDNGQADLFFNNGQLAAGEYLLRLLLQVQDGCAPSISPTIAISLNSTLSLEPTYTIDGNSALFFANAPDDAQFVWTFPDNSTSTAAIADYQFPGPGNYAVGFSMVNACGQVDTLLQINIAEPLFCQAGASSLQGCAPFVVVYTDQSTGNYTDRMWSFPGGEPAASTAASVTVSYATPGNYQAALAISGGGGVASTLLDITVVAPPVPDFEATVNDLTVGLDNTSTNATSFTWNFGDGETSTEENPTHSYGQEGAYTITLSASNGICAVAYSQTVGVMRTGTNEPYLQPLRLYPNPCQGIFQVEGLNNGQLRLFSASGQLMRQWPVRTAAYSCKGLPAGIYWLAWTAEDGNRTGAWLVLK